MEENRRPDTISYYEHEAEIARSEMHSRRWAIAALIAFIALIGTNLAWVVYESQYQDVYTATQTITQDTGEGSGTNTFSGDFYGGGDGKANGKTNDN